MAYENLLVDVQDHVGLITLNRPDRLNAINRALHDETLAVLDELQRDDRVRAVVITGAGRGFCSGADISNRAPDGTPLPEPGTAALAGQSELLDEFGWVGRQARAVYGFGKPVIAAMNGVCTGAGMSLALACDMRVGSEHARFRTIFLERNLSPDSGLSWFLPRIVGYHCAIDLILTSREVNADEAYRLGLLDRLVAHDQLMDEALNVAHQITRLPPVAVRAAKRVTQQNMQLNLDDALRNESAHIRYGRRAVNDSIEARSAFVEKRAAHYTGT
ncbi:MAG: enoyl-CoA hydratase/isomerase family protein [Vicinamibacterales bacterium]